jgi:hypothetical protein
MTAFIPMARLTGRCFGRKRSTGLNRLDYDEDPAGLYIEESLDPLEMYWDSAARKKNLSDAKRMIRVRKMPLGDARQLFPDFNEYDLNAKWVGRRAAYRTGYLQKQAGVELHVSQGPR